MWNRPTSAEGNLVEGVGGPCQSRWSRGARPWAGVSQRGTWDPSTKLSWWDRQLERQRAQRCCGTAGDPLVPSPELWRARETISNHVVLAREMLYIPSKLWDISQVHLLARRPRSRQSVQCMAERLVVSENKKPSAPKHEAEVTDGSMICQQLLVKGVIEQLCRRELPWVEGERSPGGTAEVLQDIANVGRHRPLSWLLPSVSTPSFSTTLMLLPSTLPQLKPCLGLVCPGRGPVPDQGRHCFAY